VNAKRSNINERNTTLSTFIAMAKFVGTVSVDQRSGFEDIWMKPEGLRGREWEDATAGYTAKV
jgi:hypothetical protein